MWDQIWSQSKTSLKNKSGRSQQRCRRVKQNGWVGRLGDGMNNLHAWIDLLLQMAQRSKLAGIEADKTWRLAGDGTLFTARFSACCCFFVFVPAGQTVCVGFISCKLFLQGVKEGEAGGVCVCETRTYPPHSQKPAFAPFPWGRDGGRGGLIEARIPPRVRAKACSGPSDKRDALASSCAKDSRTAPPPRWFLPESGEGTGAAPVPAPGRKKKKKRPFGSPGKWIKERRERANKHFSCFFCA